jgi:uncharacterized protein DUF6457
MEPSEEAAVRDVWLRAVGEKLGSDPSTSTPSDGDVRLLLRVTKITADVTGVRYLAPLTAYMIGRAAGAAGESFDLRSAVDAISETAEGWTPPGG